MLASTTPNEKTNTQDNLEDKELTKTKTHNNDSREVQRPTTSQGGPANVENETPKQKSPIAPHTTEQQTETLPHIERSTNLVPADHNSMETQEPQDIHPNTHNDDSHEQGMTTDRRRSTPPPDSKSTERDGDEREKGILMDTQPTGDENELKADKETSPKRSKKMKMDRHTVQPQERSRSFNTSNTIQREDVITQYTTLHHH